MYDTTFIEPLICLLYRVIGPSSVLVSYAESESNEWAYVRGNAGIFIRLRPRTFRGCKAEKPSIIDFNQPRDYSPVQWRKWVNANAKSRVAKSADTSNRYRNNRP